MDQGLLEVTVCVVWGLLDLLEVTVWTVTVCLDAEGENDGDEEMIAMMMRSNLMMIVTPMMMIM